MYNFITLPEIGSRITVHAYETRFKGTLVMGDNTTVVIQKSDNTLIHIPRWAVNLIYVHPTQD